VSILRLVDVKQIVTLNDQTARNYGAVPKEIYERSFLFTYLT